MMRTTVEIPEGFDLGSLQCHTDSWEAYDALLEEDGWEPKENAGHAWKHFRFPDGGWVACHSPDRPREEKDALGGA